MMPTVSEKYEAAIKAGKPISLADAAKAHKDKGLQQVINDLAYVDIDDARIDEVLEMPGSFGYSGPIEDMFVTWSLGGVYRTRDSNIREQSNADALEAALVDAVKSGLFPSEDYETTGCNHWAVGWVDHLSFRAIVSEEVREPTVIFMWITRWFDALEDYPVADDEDLSRREYEYALESLSDMGFRVTLPRVDLNVFESHSYEPEDWQSQVLARMNDMPREDYWHEEEAKQAALDLGFLACSECDGDGWVYEDKSKFNCDACNGSGVQAKE